MKSMNREEQATKQTGFVFIHGAGLNGGIWSEVIRGLDAPCLAVEFPRASANVRSKKRNEAGIADYISSIKRQIEDWGVQRFVLVAHSIGGVLALKLAEEFKGRVAGLVAVGAAIPENGGSFLSSLPFPQRAIYSVILRLVGTKPPEAALRSGLCNDLTDKQADVIASGFQPESRLLYTEKTGAAIPHIPKLYIKLTNDKEFTLVMQDRMIARLSAQRVVELNTGHLPMIGDPTGVRNAILSILPAAKAAIAN
ncbi:alpha/beta fold hydrolase [Paenibacillus sp. GCM10027627]|uniref:alpha/beta fold hydrolase n=1 Tax=unclassified Paenibacillus TaxID=185978 RepID=UPI0036443963